MKSLTISQPYASLIADGEKFVENRRWYTDYRGPLAIHAGKGTQYLDKLELQKYPTGCVIAIADLVTCIHVRDIQRCGRVIPATQLLGTQYTWGAVAGHLHTEGPYCWVLENVRKIESVPCSGKPGLWDLNLGDMRTSR